MTSDYTIRPARLDDLDAVVEFTMLEAHEAEGKVLDRAAVARGVRGAFDQPARARCWVAEAAGGRVVAYVSSVAEWSNFNGRDYWWVQGLFVLSDHRGGGLVDRLLDHVAAAAREAGALDLRLYAHEGNARALRAYERLGFRSTPYVIMSRPLYEETR